MNKFEAIIIGGSAGSFQVIADILNALPKTFNLPIILCFHRLRTERHGFIEALSPRSVLPIIEPLDKMPIVGGTVYLAPANYHLYVEPDRHFALSVEEPENHSRPSIDLAFYSAANVYGKSLIGIILSGANSDGARGVKSISENGGFVIVQNPEEAEVSFMPKTAIANTNVDRIINTSEIVSFLLEIT
jgi:two-component system, chemotaxis family, protein-glutamate methylesterase/glutaminase